MAPPRLTRATTTAVMMPIVVSSPSPMGRRGNPLRFARMLNSAAADRADDGDDDGDHEGPQPHGETLLGAIEARHAAGDVATGVVGDEDHEREQDGADDADGVGALRGALDGLLGGRVGRESERRAGAGDECREQHAGSDGGEPAEEGRSPLDAAELLLLARDHLALDDARILDVVRVAVAPGVGDDGGRLSTVVDADAPVVVAVDAVAAERLGAVVAPVEIPVDAGVVVRGVSGTIDAVPVVG